MCWWDVKPYSIIVANKLSLFASLLSIFLKYFLTYLFSYLHTHLTERSYVGVWMLRTVEEKGHISCTIEWPEGKVLSAQQAFIWYAFSLGFAIPVGAISIFYFLVVVRLGNVGVVQQSKGELLLCFLIFIIIVVSKFITSFSYFQLREFFSAFCK